MKRHLVMALVAISVLTVGAVYAHISSSVHTHTITHEHNEGVPGDSHDHPQHLHMCVLS